MVSERFALHRRAAGPGALPGLTLLKPLKGCNAETKQCLRSWFAQQYPGPVQILCGVAAPDDPVCGVVRELLAEFAGADARLVICGENLGANGKVSTLRQLEPHIRHPLIMVSDADVGYPWILRPVSRRFWPRRAPVLSIVFIGWPTRPRPPCAGRPSPSTPIFGARCCRPAALARWILRWARPCPCPRPCCGRSAGSRRWRIIWRMITNWGGRSRGRGGGSSFRARWWTAGKRPPAGRRFGSINCVGRGPFAFPAPAVFY